MPFVSARNDNHEAANIITSSIKPSLHIYGLILVSPQITSASAEHYAFKTLVGRDYPILNQVI